MEEKQQKQKKTNHLKDGLIKYKFKYVVRKNTDGVYIIVCKYGDIDIYNNEGILAYYHFGTAQKLTWIIKKNSKYILDKIIGDSEGIIYFKEEDIEKFVKPLLIKRRKTYSQYTLKKMQIIARTNFNLATA